MVAMCAYSAQVSYPVAACRVNVVCLSGWGLVAEGTGRVALQYPEPVGPVLGVVASGREGWTRDPPPCRAGVGRASALAHQDATGRLSAVGQGRARHRTSPSK